MAVIAGGITAVALSSSSESPPPVERAASTTTSTTSTTIDDSNTYTVATATVPVVQVIMFAPDGVTPTPDLEPRPSRMQPIPRPALNTAGVRTTDYGFAYDNPTYFDNPLNFLVVSEQGEWVEVLLQARPNGQVGWVRKTEVELSTHDAVIELDLTTRRLVARLDGEVIVDTPATIGLDANPTPTGLYFITEVIPQSWTGGAFGPFIMATSAYSEELDLFEQGMPIVALHGTNEPDKFGQKASNGCIRIDNELITLLAEKMPPAVPLVIVESPPADEPTAA